MAGASEKVITVAAKLFEARRVMRSFLGERYHEKIAEVQPYILTTMSRQKCDALPATLAVVRQLQDAGASGMVQLQMLAAGVELIEPSPSD